MTPQLPSDRLITQHHILDQQLETLQKNSDSDALAAMIHELKRHIYIEEALLFPLVNTRRLRMPLAVMYDEHAQMWQLLEALASAPDDPRPTPSITALCQLLLLHNPKEEEIIYPAIDQFHLADREPGSLLDDIADARLPGNWTPLKFAADTTTSS